MSARMAQMPPAEYRPARTTDCMAVCDECEIEWAWGAPVEFIEKQVKRHNAEKHPDAAAADVFTPTTEQVLDGDDDRYTPQTVHVRSVYAMLQGPEKAAGRRRAFDRWLAQHDAEVREKDAQLVEQRIQRFHTSPTGREDAGAGALHNLAAAIRAGGAS